MKKLLLPLALAFASNVAMAANSVDLRVTGTITPAACNISVTGGGIFDFGEIDLKDLSYSTYTSLLPVGGNTLNIQCDSDKLMAFKIIDNRQDSNNNGNSTFGLGFDNNGSPVGFYKIFYSYSTDATVDGQVGYPKISNNGGGYWNYLGSHNFYSYNLSSTIHSFSQTAADGLEPFTSLTVPLEVEANINPTSTLDISQRLSLDGSATIELVYL